MTWMLESERDTRGAQDCRRGVKRGARVAHARVGHERACLATLRALALRAHADVRDRAGLAAHLPRDGGVGAVEVHHDREVRARVSGRHLANCEIDNGGGEGDVQGELPRYRLLWRNFWHFLMSNGPNTGL